MKPVHVHLFVWDGVTWLDRTKRCQHAGTFGTICGMPKNNRCHEVPDRSAEQAEAQKRIGERDDDDT